MTENFPGPDQVAQLVRAEVPNLWAVDQCSSGTVRNWAAQEEVSLNVMCLNHPKTIS